MKRHITATYQYGKKVTTERKIQQGFGERSIYYTPADIREFETAKEAREWVEAKNCERRVFSCRENGFSEVTSINALNKMGWTLSMVNESIEWAIWSDY